MDGRFVTRSVDGLEVRLGGEPSGCPRTAGGRYPYGWRIDDPDCDRSGDTCRCTPSQLGVVLLLVDDTDRDAAAAAHLDLLVDVTGHLAAAGTGTADGPLCVHCVTDPAVHLRQLRDGVDELGDELALAALHHPLRLTYRDRR